MSADGGEAPRTVLLTFFRNYAAESKREALLTLEELATRILASKAPNKEDLPWLKCARFGETRTKKGCLRNDENVIEITGVEGDYDAKQIAFADAVAAVRSVGLRALLYTSPSYTADAPKWRIICPAAKPHHPKWRTLWMERINGLFHGTLAPESFTLSQSYFYGHVDGQPKCLTEIVEGVSIDELANLDTTARAKTGTVRGRLDEAATLDALISGENYHNSSTGLLGKWALDGVPFLDAKEKLEAAFNEVPLERRDARWAKRLADVDKVLGDIYGKEAASKDAEANEWAARFAKEQRLAPDQMAEVIDLAAERALRYDSRRKDSATKLGIKVGTLDKIVDAFRAGPEKREREATQGDVLLKIAKAAQLFHASDSTAYADVEINEHRETWPVRSKGFRDWLTRAYYERQKSAPGGYALESALSVTESRARFEADEREVYLRIAREAGKIYIDLCDDAWRAVEIGADGWRLVDRPPVRFRRAKGMLPLPVPTQGGRVEDLRGFLNVDDDGFILAVGWLLGAFAGRGPYPILVLGGEQGSAKSTFSAILRALIDPNKVPLRALLRHDEDLYIAAKNAHVLVFDNISRLAEWLSDTLCRLASGGGFSVRELYTNTDEVLFDGSRPIILNGIEDFVERPDLVDRVIILLLEKIGDQQRRTENELWTAFEAQRPAIFGALLDAVAHGLRELPDTSLATLPRMADFAQWVAACEGAVWGEEGAFERAYAANRLTGMTDLLDTDPVALAIKKLVEYPPARLTDEGDVEKNIEHAWEGTAAELLGLLNSGYAEEEARRDRNWPRTPRALGGRIRRMAPVLRHSGITVHFHKSGKHLISLREEPTPDEEPRQRDMFKPAPAVPVIEAPPAPVPVVEPPPAPSYAGGEPSGPDFAPLIFWMRERESIRIKKERGDPPPWTCDPILATWRFCNVRRSDDRVTRWIVANISERFAGHPHLWFMLCCARMINWPDTLAELIATPGAWPDSDTFTPAAMGAALDARMGRKEKTWTGAYMIRAEQDKSKPWFSWSKQRYVAEIVLGNLWEARAEFEALFAQPNVSLREAHAKLKGFYSWGDFMAYQALIDIQYTRLLASAPDRDNWAAAGPGTIRGLNRLHKRRIEIVLDQVRALREMREVYAAVRRELPEVVIAFADVGNVLCEVEKWLRVKNGEGKPRANYVPGRGA